MKVTFLTRAAAVSSILAITGSAWAQNVVSYDQNLVSPPGVYFGTGNANGGWTVDNNASANIQLGLRGKTYFGNTFPDNGDGVYVFNQGASPANPNRATWNFEFSINVNASGLGTANLGSYTYRLLVDSDPSAADNFTTIDPFATYHDNELAKMGGATSGPSGRIYNGNNANNANYDVAQNSENPVFGLPVGDLANNPGQYDFVLEVLNRDNTVIASDEITIDVVPEVSYTLPMLGLGVIGLAFAGRRMQAKVA